MSNLKYKIIEFFEDLRWFIEDNIKWVLTGIFILIFGGLITIVMVKKSNNENPERAIKEDSVEQLTLLKQNGEHLRERYSELSFTNKSDLNGEYVFEVNLYLKEPFIREGDVKDDMDKYIDALKIKYNVDDKKVRAVKINFYDRHVVYERRLHPRGVYTYGVKQELTPQYEEVNKKKKKKDENEQVKADIPLNEYIYEYTSDRKQYKKINYEEYEPVFFFEEIEETPGIIPLSDEEFEWFLKFDMYRTLAGSQNAGVKLYMEWELGLEPTEQVSRVVEGTFEVFMKRLHGINAYSDYYEDYGTIALKEDLVIENPQMLNFAENKTIILDPNEARKSLIDNNPEMYSDAVENWISQQGQNYDEKLDDPASEDYVSELEKQAKKDKELLENTSGEDDIFEKTEESKDKAE